MGRPINNKGQSSGGTGLGRVGLSISEKGTNPNLISRVSNEENVGSKAKGGGRWKQRARAVVSQETTTDGRIRIGNQWDVVVQAESLIRNQSDEDGVGVVDRHERVMMPSVLGKHVGIDADGKDQHGGFPYLGVQKKSKLFEDGVVFTI
ncbi:hypothetical protein LWI28_014742 [Acer negundo]|uniref:Uncharacterized protein n=1 Tax=Acer negundo TaxID=4023 RepID=A0AAD5IW28_ACENE|nr:hypothetical protein LWI28_014742 [Acer negundo]